jgi:hypothetical protein
MAFYLGRAGALVQLPEPAQNIEPPRTRLGGTHELLAGLVRDTIGYRGQTTLKWEGITDDEYSLLETLFELPGPYRYVSPTRRNQLTANQSTATDALRTTEGFSAPFQGTVTSDTAQARTGLRSLRWDTVTSLTLTNRGVYLPASAGTPDATWAAVVPSTVYTFSTYARASAAISMYGAVDWKDAAGATISTDFGTGTAVSTTDWSTRLTCANKTSPSSAAYAVPAVLDSAAPSAIRQVWIDNPQLEQAAAASAWTFGTGVGWVTIDSLVPTARFKPYYDATMVLLEIT